MPSKLGHTADVPASIDSTIFVEIRSWSVLIYSSRVTQSLALFDKAYKVISTTRTAKLRHERDDRILSLPPKHFSSRFVVSHRGRLMISES